MILNNGYRMLRMPKHPLAVDGYVAEHRLIAQEHFGVDLLARGLHVHHIDGNRQNNAPSNLQIVTPRTHRRLHCGWKKIRGQWWRTCAKCRRLLRVARCFYHGKKQVVSRCKMCIAANRTSRAQG